MKKDAQKPRPSALSAQRSTAAKLIVALLWIVEKKYVLSQAKITVGRVLADGLGIKIFGSHSIKN